MNQKMEWLFAFRNLFRSKRRTRATAIGLVIAFVGISLLFGHLAKTEKTISVFVIYVHHLGHFSIYKTGAADGLESDFKKYHVSADQLTAVHEILGKYKDKIDISAGFLSMEALLSTGQQSVPIWVQGFPPELDDYVRLHPLVKRWMGPAFYKVYGERTIHQAVQEVPDALSISHGVSELMNRTRNIEEMSQEEREVSIAGRNIDGDFNAVNATLALKHATGMPFIEDVSVLAPLRVVQDLMVTKGVGHVVVYLKDPSDLRGMVADLREEIRSRHLDLEVLPFHDERIGYYYNGTMSYLYIMGTFFGVLILGASALIVVNSITMGVLERLREVGTLRSIGFTPSQVRRLFVKESIWLSLFSSVVGIGLAELLAFGINSLGIDYEAPGLIIRIPLELVNGPMFYLTLGSLMLVVSVALTYYIVTKKTKERVSVLLLESEASV